MTLTTEEMQKILVEETMGKEPSITGPDAQRFRKDLKADLEEANKKGWTVVIPNEWEVG